MRSENKRYFVVHKNQEGIVNVGFFDAYSPKQAEVIAKEKWGTLTGLYVISVDGIYDGWSYYS